MRKTLKEISEISDGEVLGDENTIITNVAGITEAKKGDITFVSNPKYEQYISSTNASAIIIKESQKDKVKIPSIVSKNPYLSYAKIIMHIAKETEKHPAGISCNCSVSKSAKIEGCVAISDFVVVDENAKIDDGTIIYPNCYIGRNVKIGKKCLIYPNVTVRENIVIGNNVIIHSGTVIGSDGFGYVQENGLLKKIPQIGIVEIADDVEIGANVTIDRATTGKTFIGKGTKIDNLVQIAHNVQIGNNSIIVSQAGISGSTKIGNGVTVAGQAGLIGHITVGDGAIIAAQAGVIGDVPAKETVSGYPARPHKHAMKIYALIQKLPELFEEIKKLKK
ncbi:MAG TPA: UDP-3-O-(3-hydroxymyristoyl)glucosamine N-acyltransferase [Elusimicrobia bacterium]|nr:UDP-3-O-(3-hydroxymyristoyl)glucosamine N-acyltransferase [Elusimicrobiota bacterium]